MSTRSARVLSVMGLAAFAVGLAMSVASPLALSRPIGAGEAVVSFPVNDGNRLINPDFENGYSYSLPCCNNIAVPVGWNIRWYTDTAIMINGIAYAFKQPEVKIIDNTKWPFCDGCAPNIPPRIHSGRYAADSFTLFAPQDTTLYQQVGHIPLGAIVSGSAWLHAWASSCNPFPKNATIQLPAISLQGPNDANNGYQCAANLWPIDTTHMMVGIDPLGGTDPRAAAVIWNWSQSHPAWWGPYDYYSPTLPVTVTAQSYTVTLFLRGVTRQPTRYDDVYFDAASLTYSFPLQWRIDQTREWPLSTSMTIELQTPVSLTQTSAVIQSPIGDLIPPHSLGSSAAVPYTLTWWFVPVAEGSYLFTATAHELPDPLVKAIEVRTLPFAYRQAHLLSPVVVSDTTVVTYSISSPVTLTNFTSIVNDPFAAPLATTLVSSQVIDGRYDLTWQFTAQASGWHTVTMNAAEFVQPFLRRILVIATRVYLPIVLRG